MRALNDTHDPTLSSWVDTANLPGGDFPLQNLPFGVFRRNGSAQAFRGAVAIGDSLLDLGALHVARVASGSAGEAVAAGAQAELNGLMSLGPAAAGELRVFLSAALRRGSALEARLRAMLVPQSEAQMSLPAHIGDYTDFYTSIHHATSVGRLFRPDNPLLPNYKWLPIGYHGRSSSIRVSPQAFVRPLGQTLPSGATQPVFGPSRRLDYELELGAFIGAGNALGTRIGVDSAEDHVFGLCLLNDWSARDLQAWEYQPLGPFLSKNFATTISPWVVTLEALAPFRSAWTRPVGDPQPLPYLDGQQLRSAGGIEIEFDLGLVTAKMRQAGGNAHRLSRSNFRHAYWTVAQMVAHHTVNGCNLQSGDLLGSGTQSGPTPGEAGSLLELTVGGKQPLQLPSGESRSFIEDGDQLIYRGWCERAGYARIGFGTAIGSVLPAA